MRPTTALQISSSIHTVNVGFGISPNHASRLVGFYHRLGITPCPEDTRPYSIKFILPGNEIIVKRRARLQKPRKHAMLSERIYAKNGPEIPPKTVPLTTLEERRHERKRSIRNICERSARTTGGVDGRGEEARSRQCLRQKDEGTGVHRRTGGAAPRKRFVFPREGGPSERRHARRNYQRRARSGFRPRETSSSRRSRPRWKRSTRRDRPWVN